MNDARIETDGTKIQFVSDSGVLVEFTFSGNVIIQLPGSMW